MRTFIAFGSFALVLCVASLAAAQGHNSGGPKGTGDSHKGTTGKSSTSSSTTKKADNSQHYSGKVDLHAHKHPLPKDAKGPSTTKTQTKEHYVHVAQLKTSLNSGNLKLDAGQKAAVDKLTSQQPLTYEDRQQLSDLLFKGSQAGLTSEDEASLSYLLTDDMARNEGTASPEKQTADSSAGPMYLRVVNKTNESIKVWVQVLAKETEVATAGKTPAPETLCYELAPGKAYDLHHKGQRLLASKIHIWAMSPTQKWASNRDQDLPLTSASSSKLFTVTFAPPTLSTAGTDITTKASTGGQTK